MEPLVYKKVYTLAFYQYLKTIRFLSISNQFFFVTKNKNPLLNHFIVKALLCKPVQEVKSKRLPPDYYLYEN